MDYPLSLAASLDLKDGRFTDGIPGLYPASVNPSQTFNDVIDEILAVQDEGGVIRNEFNRTQLKTAIKNMIEARVGDYSIDTGAANAYVIAMNPPIDAYPNGMPFRFRATHANTTGSTLNAGGGVVALVRDDGTALQPGDITLGMLVSGFYDKPSNLAIISSLVTSQTLTQAIADLRYLQLGMVSLPSGFPTMWPTLDCPIWAVVRDGSALTRTPYPGLFAVLAPLRSCTITINAAGAVVSGLTRTSDLWVGMPAEHANLAAGTTIKSIDSTSQVTLSNNATATVAGTTIRFFLHGYGTGGSVFTFGLPDDRGLFERALDGGARGYQKTILSGTTTLGNNVITGVSSTRGLFIGQPISATAAISAGVTITGLTSSTITMSAVSPQAGSAVITVVGGQVGNERNDSMQGHAHNLRAGGAAVIAFITGGDKGPTGGGEIYTSFTQTAEAVSDGSNGTPRTGPENRPRFRDYLAIMVI